MAWKALRRKKAKMTNPGRREMTGELTFTRFTGDLIEVVSTCSTRTDDTRQIGRAMFLLRCEQGENLRLVFVSDRRQNQYLRSLTLHLRRLHAE